MKLIRRTFSLFLVIFASFSLIFQPVAAQNDDPLAIVMTAEGPIMPPMLEYIRRGIEAADRRNAEVLIIELNTPGGSLDTMIEIISEIRSSNVPVVVYVAPRNAMAGSAGAMITMAGHASAMAPETSIGASSPISGSGENLDSTSAEKAKEISKAAIRDFVSPRGTEALALAEAMIDDAKAATATEALEANLIDFVVDNIDDLLESLDGFTVQMNDGPRTLDTASAATEPFEMTFIEEFLLLLTNPNIAF
ncbi:MAG: nodulation protein NfeD, partial [Anaerolineales bacterium]|nr:nodulation protein NfeD [Anaerolineales bacterium]